MIQVKELIPQVYNQSRDFGVFTGVMQILLNELDQKSRVLSSLPDEDLLPYRLASYPSVKKYFRTLLKYKGSIEAILYSLYLSGGGIFSFKAEREALKEIEIDPDLVYFERNKDLWSSCYDGKTIPVEKLVYYLKREATYTIIYINVKKESLGNFNQDLFRELCYYIKPINALVSLVLV